MLEIKFEKENNRSACYDTSETMNGDYKFVGECTFAESEGLWTANHTFVAPEYGGQGLAKKMLECLVAAARENGAKITPTCSFVVKEFDAHPELYADLRQ